MIGGAAVRLIALVAGVALVVLPGVLEIPALVLTIVGVALAVIVPRQVGCLVASAGFVFAWLDHYGFGSAPPVAPTVLGAVALYVLHQSTALAAAVPVRAELPLAALRPFLRRSLITLGVSAVVIAVDLAVPRTSGPAVVELSGLVGVLVLLFVVPLRRRQP